jgi:hypothetical protein
MGGWRGNAQDAQRAAEDAGRRHQADAGWEQVEAEEQGKFEAYVRHMGKQPSPEQMRAWRTAAIRMWVDAEYQPE